MVLFRNLLRYWNGVALQIYFPGESTRPFLSSLSHFTSVFALPDGMVFIVAGNQSIIYDIEAKTETILPDIPERRRPRISYPESYTSCGKVTTAMDRSTEHFSIVESPVFSRISFAFILGLAEE